MYYPYLRGKQHELLAIRRTANQMAQAGTITPIIEPIKEKGLATATREVLDAGASIVILTNPGVGDLVGAPDPLRKPEMAQSLANYSTLIPGYLITPQTSVANVRAFLNRHRRREVCFVHKAMPSNATTISNISNLLNSHTQVVSHIFAESGTAQSYRSVFTSSNCSILTDRFNRQIRNADYPPDEFFSDAHQTYASSGFAGFSDYSIVGSIFSKPGGPAHAVTIHFPYQHSGNALWIRHFISDQTTGAANPAGKFHEAVRKLNRFAQRNAFAAQTNACQEFCQHFTTGHYPGLGAVKQLSIRHHIELMALIL